LPIIRALAKAPFKEKGLLLFIFNKNYDFDTNISLFDFRLGAIDKY